METQIIELNKTLRAMLDAEDRLDAEAKKYAELSMEVEEIRASRVPSDNASALRARIRELEAENQRLSIALQRFLDEF